MFCTLPQIFGQKFNFTTYQVDDGLPQSTVYEIFQDKDNFLWVGTDGGGLCRYDGFRFKYFGKSNGLKGNVIKRIVQDSHNTIWVATNNGLYYIKSDTARLLEGLPDNATIYFTSVIVDAQKNIWASTSGNGIFNISNQNDKYLVKNFTSTNGLSSDYVFDICSDENGKIWIASFGSGIDIYDTKSKSFQTIKFEPQQLNEIICLKNLNKNQMAFGTKSAGAYITNTNTTSKLSYTIIPETANTQVWSIAVDADNNYWVATDISGVVCSNKNFNLNITVGLQSNKIYKVFIDREKNTWIGTDAGMAKYSGNRFTHITNSELNGLTEVSSVVQDKTNTYWIATTSAGLFQLKYSNNRSTLIKQFTSSNGLPSNEITNLCIAKDNSLWMSTKNGACNYNGKNFKTFSETDGLGSNTSNCILSDSKGRVWIGTSGGLSLINEEKKLSNMSESNGLINNEVTCLYEDAKGNIWIATYGGLMKFDNASLVSFNEKNGLTEKKINSLAEDKNGNIYIGTFGSGIFKLDVTSSSEKNIYPLCAENKLASGNITSLIFQNDSILIAGTNLGLNKIVFNKELKVKTISYFGKLDGFKNIENTINAVVKDNNNDIWFGTKKGITLYHPLQDKVNNVKPNFSLAGLKINGTDYPLNNEIKLSHNENTIKISFISISLTNPSGNMYYSKLLGQDTTWNKLLIDKQDANDFAFAEYKKLQPGYYELLLKSKNNDGIESEVISLKFYISQPFYKTKWFILSSILVFITIVYFFFKYREKKLLKEKEKLEIIVTERTAEVVASKKEIESQKDLLEIQKHEITDSINYSKRIQNAILPEQSFLFKNIEHSFILYQPKDIVSGDFYFFEEGKEGRFYLAVADCTGHGVPGAFMSMIGSKELIEVIKTNHQPSDILSALNIGVRKTLKQSNLEIGIKDGMDIGFLLIDTKLKNEKLNVWYSGANRPLWILRKNEKEILEIKATKTAIGGYTLDDQVFAQHEVVLEKGDAIYLFSDGYADQFGGDSGKKMMTKRFKELLIENSHLAMKEQGNMLGDYFNKWKGSANEQVDDVLIIGVRA